VSDSKRTETGLISKTRFKAAVFLHKNSDGIPLDMQDRFKPVGTTLSVLKDSRGDMVCDFSFVHSEMNLFFSRLKGSGCACADQAPKQNVN